MCVDGLRASHGVTSSSPPCFACRAQRSRAHTRTRTRTHSLTVKHFRACAESRFDLVC